MNDAAYHHHQSTSANLLAHVSLDKLIHESKPVAVSTTNDIVVDKPKDEKNKL